MNRFVISALVLAAIVAVGFSDDLCTPDQWEGYEASFGGYVYHRRPGIVREHNFVAYDAKNERTASFITYSNNEYENKFQIITRHGDGDSGKIYVVDLRKGTCWTKTLTRPFRKACIPEKGRKKIHSYVMGPAKGGLNVTGYLVRGEEAGVYLAVVQDGNTIIPVTETVHGNFKSMSFIQGIQFAEITGSIKNETIFNIPKQCQDKDDESIIPEYLQREHFILGI